MKPLTLSLLLFVSVTAWCAPAKADCVYQCPVNRDNVADYHDADHFQWTNYDNDVHLMVGFSGALIIGQALHRYADLPAWESALIGAVVMGLVGTGKEVLFDTYTSRTDIKTYWAGGLAGGVTVLSLNF